MIKGEQLYKAGFKSGYKGGTLGHYSSIHGRNLEYLMTGVCNKCISMCKREGLEECDFYEERQ